MSDGLILGAAADQKNPLLPAAMAGSSCFQYMGGITAGGDEGVVDDCRAQVNVWAAWLAGDGGVGGGGGVEEQLGGGGRGGSRRPSMKIRRLRAEQVRALDASFAHDAKLTAERKEELARQVGLQPRQVAIWFQNRKQRSKMKQLQLDFSALSSDYHSLLADTHRLKAKVAQLTKELEHAKRGKLQIEGLAPKQHFLLDALKGEHELKGVPPFITSESTPDEMMTIMSHAQQSSPSHSDYSVVVDSENPNSRNQKDASAYNDSNMENLQFCYISHDWNQEDPFATHQILTTSAHVTTMQSQHLVLGEPLYSNNITHATTDRLWSCFPLPELSNLK